MNFKQIKHYRTVDKENYLGYSCCNVFEGNNKEITVNDVFRNKLLSDKYDKFLNKKSLFKSVQEIFKTNHLENEFGPINLSKVEISDFKKTDYKGLLLYFENYWKDENWGEDLELFKINFSNTLSILSDYNLESREYYYINLEEARNEIFFSDKNCWIYFVGIFSVEVEKGNVITACFGND